jgi:uncharacterized damage-inducible protein DinB
VGIMTKTDIRRLVAYNEWANSRMLEAAAALTVDRFTRKLGSSFSSIRDTLGHIIGVEWVWLRRWKGESPRDTPGWMATAEVGTLRAELGKIERERAVFLDSIDDVDLQRRIAYTNFKGERWEYSLGDMLLHLVNHSTYHRGQVVTLLRLVGANAPATDLLLFNDEQASAAGG